MNNLLKSLKTEYIKKKQSGIFTLSIIIGVFLPIAFFIASFFWDKEKPGVKIPVNVYFEYLKAVLIPFTSFFFPILIIIITSKIAQIDHKNRGWHLMETQPVTKFSIYFSKFILLLASNLIAIIAFLLSILLFTWITTLIRDVPSNSILTIPSINFLKVGVKLFVISLCITAFQYMLSVVIKSFIWPILIGFLSMLLPVMLLPYKNQLFWYPYSLLGNIGANPKGSDFGNWFTYVDVLSVLFTLLFLFIGFNWYKFKTFFNAFLHSKINVLKFIGALAIIGFLIAFTIKPKLQQPYNKTIISGTIESDKEIKNVYVLDHLIKDTIAKIEVVNNTFHKIIHEKIPSNSYLIEFDYYYKASIYFSEKDSLHIDYKLFGENNSLTINGTRLAENQPEKKQFRWNYINYNLNQNQRIDDASFYMDGIYKSWEKELFNLKDVRTIDNLIPRNDFKEIRQKEVTLKHVTYWNRFKKLRKSLYPNRDYTVSDGMKELEKSLSKTNYNLLSNNTYFDFVMDDLIKDDKREVNEDEKYFNAISALKKGMFKDKLLFTHLKKNIEETTSVKVRDSLIDLYLNDIEKKSYKELILSKKSNLNRLSTGIDAPNFVVYDKNNKEYQLDSFKGKFLLIDVWASWCGPCLIQSPYFEKKALDYENENINFIAISMDAKKTDWLLAIQDKGQTILQLHSNNRIGFSKDYNMPTIPHFILIDPNGKLVDADFERPTTKNFDTLLKMYMDKSPN